MSDGTDSRIAHYQTREFRKAGNVSRASAPTYKVERCADGWVVRLGSKVLAVRGTEQEAERVVRELQQ